MFDPSQPPLVSETLLKKRRSLDDLALRRSTNLQNQNKRKRIVRGENIKIKRPEQFVKEYRIREGSQNKMSRKKRNTTLQTKKAFIPPEESKETVGFIVRIHQGRHSSKEIKQELKKLGLIKKYDATFHKMDRESIAQLKPLDSYIAYGFISKKLVVELVHRRAYIMADGNKKPLSDNITVENALAEKNIICLSDLSHEIFNVGSNFEDACKFLCAFNLASPVGHYEKEVLRVHDKEEKGGFLSGDRMETFLSKIL